MFRWELILEKLEFVKRLVTTDAPVALLRLADALDKLEEATREAAEWLDALGGEPGGTIMSIEEKAGLDRLEAFRAECEKALAAPRPSADPGTQGWEQIIIPIIIRLIEEFLKRRRPQPA